MSSAALEVRSSTTLRQIFLSELGRFSEDSCYSLPALPPKVASIVLLGTTDFSSAFISQATGDIPIVGVVNDLKAGTNARFHGIPIISSVELLALAKKGSLITVNGCRYDHARRYFKNLTRQHNLPMLNFEQAIRWQNTECRDHRVQDWGRYIFDNSQRFLELADRMDDEYSKITLYSVLLSHLTCDLEWTLEVAKPYCTLYFRSGLWRPKKNERFVDCGASIAESSKAFLDATDGVFEKIWMVEPDEINQKTLGKFIDEYSSQFSIAPTGSLELLNYALGNETSEMPFSHQGGHGGVLLNPSLSDVVGSNVSIRKLDDLVKEPVTIIKMDIEGAELEALKGAQGHIAQSRPTLLVSAYHRSSDLLDIVSFVESVRGDYKVGLRHHTEERWDTCLYFY
ncbi:FkbM family methyltransferase [Pseudomonas chlororaphis subsp. aurantiaca]|uniref:FkbM family methyltransferase n=1 Tax=Pseudomonas chlororaphis TaxID=587753 RepID=UPI0027DC1C82|nr:FkbM family methyltransferase [Pseudomonas chlororaphis]WMI97586.1 FkbM family methyltransferase [Pseudomonas chlororaphis subsp. aurantiaca]